MAKTTKAAAKPAKTRAATRPPVTDGHATKATWKHPHDGTMRARVLRAMVEPRTVAEIAAAAGVPEDRVLPHVYATWRDCGIGYKVDGEKYVAMLPEGETVETIFRPAT